MPIQINCPSCKGAVRVPEDLLGKRVQCPRCQATFVAEIEDEPSPPAEAPATSEKPDEAGQPVPSRRPPRAAGVDEYDDHDDYYDRPRRTYGRPHRGAAVLTLGILSLVFPLPCAPLGIFAWVMGSNDLTEMRRGQMDRSGEGLTQAGRILGIISTVLMILGCVFYTFFFALMGLAHF
jgi:predicted Zn finger-like uncharacterized protein